MARGQKEERVIEALPEVTEAGSLGVMLAAAIAAAPIGPAHGALTAIETALTDLKARAATVDEHLRDEYTPIIESIKAL